MSRGLPITPTSTLAGSEEYAFFKLKETFKAPTGSPNSGDTIAEYLYDEAEKNFPGRKIRTDKSDGDRDWETNFYICQKSKCPAVLTENFFYDNEDDVKYILSEEGRKAVIKTHIDAIVNYIKDTF